MTCYSVSSTASSLRLLVTHLSCIFQIHFYHITILQQPPGSSALSLYANLRTQNDGINHVFLQPLAHFDKFLETEQVP